MQYKAQLELLRQQIPVGIKHGLALLNKTNGDSDEARHPAPYCLLAVQEWLNYEDWEGLDTAVYFHTGIVAALIRNELQLPETAHIITAAKARMDALLPVYQETKDHSTIGEDAVLGGLRAGFRNGRPLIIERLYAYVVSNLRHFP